MVIRYENVQLNNVTKLKNNIVFLHVCFIETNVECWFLALALWFLALWLLAFVLGACLLAFALRGWLEALARWHWQFGFWLCSVYWEPISRDQ